MKIIAVSSIQHHIGGAAGTCNDVTCTEGAVLLPDHARYPGYPLNSYIKEAIQEYEHDTARCTEKPIGGRCINTLATHISNSPDVAWAYILSGSADAYGFALRGR
jgi:hypothetical protein